MWELNLKILKSNFLNGDRYVHSSTLSKTRGWLAEVRYEILKKISKYLYLKFQLGGGSISLSSFWFGRGKV